MSHLSHDAYVAVVAPERVLLVRRRKGWLRRGDFDLTLDAPWAGAPTAAAQALAQLVQRPEMGAGTLQILVSSHFVRYLLVPWRAEVTHPEEFAAYVRICCDQTYGVASAGRSLRTSAEKEGGPRLTAAMDTALLEALSQAGGAGPLRLASVQPYLAAAYNRLSRHLPRKQFIFFVAEPGRSCLLVASQGRWRSVRASASEDQPHTIAALIEREARLLGLGDDEVPPVFVHAPRQAALTLSECHGRVPKILHLPLPAAFAQRADPLLSMAMAGG